MSKKTQYSSLNIRCSPKSAYDMTIYNALDKNVRLLQASKTGFVKYLLNKVLLETKNIEQFSDANILKYIDMENLTNENNGEKIKSIQLKFYDNNDADFKIYKALENLNLVGVSKTNFVKNVLYFYLFCDNENKKVEEKEAEGIKEIMNRNSKNDVKNSIDIINSFKND